MTAGSKGLKSSSPGAKKFEYVKEPPCIGNLFASPVPRIKPELGKSIVVSVIANSLPENRAAHLSSPLKASFLIEIPESLENKAAMICTTVAVSIILNDIVVMSAFCKRVVSCLSSFNSVLMSLAVIITLDSNSKTRLLVKSN